MKSKILLLIIFFNIIDVSSQEYDGLLKLHNDAKKAFSETLFQMENTYHVINTFSFGPDPFTGELILIDYLYIACELNSLIFSITDGEVIEINYNVDMKHYIKIKYDEYEIVYGNLLDFDTEVGDKIVKGQIIAHGGRLLEPQGNCLLIKIMYKNIPLNPNIILNYDGRKYDEFKEFLEEMLKDTWEEYN